MKHLGQHFRLALPVLVLGLVAVPLWLIFAHERTLTRGEIYRFRTVPIDPYDAFRGRYVALGFPVMETHVPAGLTLRAGKKFFVTVERDDQGFARLEEISTARPPGTNYLRLAVESTSHGRARWALPFDRFYMNELQAPEAERAYRRGAASRDGDSWVAVRIYKGRAVIEDLFVDGRPIREVIDEEPEG